MKTTIRIIAGGIVVAAFAIFWWWDGLPVPLKTARTIAGRILHQSYFKIGNLPVTPIFVRKTAIFLFLLAVAVRAWDGG